MAQPSQSNHRVSAIWVLVALFAASIEPIVVKLGYRGSLSPWQALAYKNIVAAFVIMLLTRSWSSITKDNLLRVFPVSLLLMCTYGLVLFALKFTSVVTVVTLISTTPAFVALVNHKKGRDTLTPKFWFGFALCFLGVLLTVDAVSLGAHQVSLVGVLCLVGAVISSTTYRTTIEHVTQTVPPKHLSTNIFFINGILSAVFILPWCGALTLQEFGLTTWMGVAAAVANFAFLTAIHLVGSTRMSIFDMLQRPLVIVFAAIILDEPFIPIQILGVVLVLLGIQMAKVQRKVKSDKSDAAPVVAEASAVKA